MSNINVLDSTVFNRIAAGEVVENPRSVVKELVENSIDAGADTIGVEIRGGGIEYICVTDNGKGMEKEDMPLAFLPHATSKIRVLQDLENITSLGFRGEALPSIASVAQVDMISRTQGSDLGYKIVLHGGKITEEGECGAPYGTKIAVRNLFGTVPARAKFLRKPQAEENAVTECIAKMILANPDIKIKYTVDEKVIYRSDGSGMQSAVSTVYGLQFLQNTAPVSYTAPGTKLTGLIGKPDFTKHNRTYQTLVVNGRYILNADMSFCIQQCYQEYLMKRQYPVYVLYLTVPSDFVDVNVHPNKLDVRFVNEKKLKGMIYTAVKQTVDELAVLPAAFSPIIERPAADTTVREIQELDTPTQTNVHTKITDYTMHEDGIVRMKLQNFIRSAYDRQTSPENTFSANNGLTAQETENTQPQQTAFAQDLQTRFAGKLFNTYLFIEKGNNFYIIDQHAAHEKLLYDALVKQYAEGETAIQDLLVPYIFEVTPKEKDFLIDRLPLFDACGFKIDEVNDNTFSLHALPVCCCPLDPKKFVTTLLSDTTPENTVPFIKEKLMQAACKSAVKGEDDLTQNEIDHLLSQMAKAGTTRFCPHGRPIVLTFDKSNLEKIFKRTI